MQRIMAALLAALLVGAAGADVHHQLGYRDDTTLIPSQGDDCAQGVLFYNHDDSPENGYAWGFGGTVPPYYGAWAEAYDLGPGTIECATYWFSQVGYFQGDPMDCYVWEGGVTAEPAGVICMVPGVVPENMPYWPDCGQNDIDIGCCIGDREFTIGYWADFSDQTPQWYICSDVNGFFGYPWTCIAPGIGYPTGWNHVNVVFDYCISLFIGGYFSESPSPVESRTWGDVKALFH